MRVEKSFPGRNVPQRTRVNVAVRVSYRWMENGDPGILQLLQVARLERRWIAPPRGKLFKIQREQTEHVDHGGLTHQVQRARTVLCLALSEERKPAPVQERRA